MIEIIFNKQEAKSVAYDNNTQIGECYFIELKECWNIVHTKVNSSYQGQGIARRLVENIIENAKKYDKSIIADCLYAKKILENEKYKGEDKLLEGIEVLYHSSIRFNKGKTIYFDPFKIKKNYNDADIIFITHDHYDHYSEEDIDKVVKKDTVIVAPKDLLTKLLKKGFEKENIITVRTNESYTVKGIECQTIPAYNINKQFHPKENKWVGYLIKFKGSTYYIAGDTDITEENKKVKCDVAFVPVGGTFTMDYKEAAEFINEIKPKVAVPTHYGSIVGSKEDGVNFLELVNPEIKVEIITKI